MEQLFTKEEVGRRMQMAIDLACENFYSLEKEWANKIMWTVKFNSLREDKQHWESLDENNFITPK